MPFDITIERSGSTLPPIHYWTGYDAHYYAHGAMASVARILIDETYHPQAEYAVEGVFAEDGSIPLVRDGKPYATVRVVETPVHRPDVPIWGTLRGRVTHQIVAWIGEDQATSRCGRVLDRVAMRFEKMGQSLVDNGPSICTICLKAGALRDHAEAARTPNQSKRTVSPSLFMG